MREAWTDDRLDRLNHGVDEGFTQVDHRFELVDKRFDRLEAEADWRFDKVMVELHRVHDRMDAAMRAAWYIGGGIIAALLGIVIQS